VQESWLRHGWLRRWRRIWLIVVVFFFVTVVCTVHLLTLLSLIGCYHLLQAPIAFATDDRYSELTKASSNESNPDSVASHNQISCDRNYRKDTRHGTGMISASRRVLIHRSPTLRMHRIHTTRATPVASLSSLLSRSCSPWCGTCGTCAPWWWKFSKSLPNRLRSDLTWDLGNFDRDHTKWKVCRPFGLYP